MKMLVSGSNGLIGSHLVPFLEGKGHEVVRLVRGKADPREREISWNPADGTLNAADLEKLDAVVHLAAENVGNARWTPEKKALIRSSRVEGTRLLAETLSRLSYPPRVLVCASAVGYYGDRGSEVLQEESEAGSGFLAGVVREWEAASKAAAEKGIRVVNLRIGIVLSSKGGALARMLIPFKLGVGGKVGSGKQYISWITMEDLVRSVLHVLVNNSLQGPVNAVAPNPVTNLEFAKTLGRVLDRSTFLATPAFVARLALGEAAKDLLLASARVHPTRLEASGFAFEHPVLEEALRHVLGAR